MRKSSHLVLYLLLLFTALSNQFGYHQTNLTPRADADVKQGNGKPDAAAVSLVSSFIKAGQQQNTSAALALFDPQFHNQEMRDKITVLFDNHKFFQRYRQIHIDSVNSLSEQSDETVDQVVSVSGTITSSRPPTTRFTAQLINTQKHWQLISIDMEQDDR